MPLSAHSCAARFFLEWGCSIRLQGLPWRALPALDQLTLVAFCLLGGWLRVSWCAVALGTFLPNTLARFLVRNGFQCGLHCSSTYNHYLSALACAAVSWGPMSSTLTA